MVGTYQPKEVNWLANLIWEYCTEGFPEARVLVRKLSQLTWLSYAKQANPMYFIMLCGISCELAGCAHRPIVDSESIIAG